MTKANAPPTPIFAVRLQDLSSKRVVVVNFSESTRVKAPQTTESDIPIVVQVRQYGKRRFHFMRQLWRKRVRRGKNPPSRVAKIVHGSARKLVW